VQAGAACHAAVLAYSLFVCSAWQLYCLLCSCAEVQLVGVLCPHALLAYGRQQVPAVNVMGRRCLHGKQGVVYVCAQRASCVYVSAAVICHAGVVIPCCCGQRVVMVVVVAVCCECCANAFLGSPVAAQTVSSRRQSGAAIASKCCVVGLWVWCQFVSCMYVWGLWCEGLRGLVAGLLASWEHEAVAI
jgi:hypothetical protein